MTPLKKLAILALFLFLPALPASAAYDEAFWQNLAKRPDVEIKDRGDGQRIATFKSGVEIHESGKEWDNSGLGAVKCNWDMYVAVKNSIEICALPASAHLDYALEKTKAFIIANNLTPITSADLDAEIAANLEKEKALYEKASEDRRAKICTESMPIMFEKSLSAMPIDQFKQAVEHSLSVPRPPVSKPCM